MVNKQRRYALMHLTAGQRLLDVGCGPGKAVGASGSSNSCRIRNRSLAEGRAVTVAEVMA